MNAKTFDCAVIDKNLLNCLKCSSVCRVHWINLSNMFHIRILSRLKN